MYQLTEHALERVSERLNISPEWVLELLESSSVEVTCREGSPRRHRVFWSIPDESPFVAVVNKKTGVVITVLPGWRDNLSSSILTDTDPAAGTVHTAHIRKAVVHEAMRLAGITPPPARKSERAFDKEFVARYLDCKGMNKVKVVARMKDGDDLDEKLDAAIEKAMQLAGEHGALGMTIELRNRGELTSLQEWVLEEAVSYGVGE